MPDALAIAIPLVIAGVFVASGLAKLRQPDDMAGWLALGVPGALRRSWVLRLHPWGEIGLGVMLAVFGGFIGLLGALASLILMGLYSVLVWRVLRRQDGASCSCFGASRPITQLTVVRNLWLTTLSVGAVAVVWMNPLLGGAIAAVITTAGAWAWTIALAITGLTVVLILWPEEATAERPRVSEAVGPSPLDDDVLDYLRTRTPAVPVALGDGQVVNLRRITAHRPLLLLAVSETCGPCRPIIERIDEWRQLLPEVDVRFLLSTEPGVGELTNPTEPQSMHDPNGYVSGSIADWATPTAVLFGVDGLLAGGPVTGSDVIPAFIEDVYASLHGHSPAEAPAHDAAVSEH